MSLGGTPVISKDKNFKWVTNNNFTAYETTVEELPVELVAYGTADINHAIVGQPLGVFRGTYAVKDDEGNLLIDPTTGKIIFSDDVGLDDDVIGDPNEDWRFSSINTFTYKNLSLSAQIDYIHGGDIYSNTASNLLRRGVTRDTENREGTFILPGVLGDPATGTVLTDTDGNKIPNNVQIGANDVYFINLQDVDENLVYDATTIRLRDVTITYCLPKKGC